MLAFCPSLMQRRLAPHISRCRRLHARHAKGVATAFSADQLHLCPVHGLLLYGSKALGSLWAAGEADGPSVARLARTLFNRHEPDEPLVPAQNRSHPAVFLGRSPELQGHCLGLALRGASDDEVRSVLYELGVDAVARESKVSLARFQRLVRLMSEAVQARQSLSADGGLQPAQHSCVQVGGIEVALAFAWATSRSKRCLLTFLFALQQRIPERRLFAADPDSVTERWVSQFEDAFGEEVQYMLGGGSRSVAPSEAELAALCEGISIPCAALERLAFQIVARGGCAPEVPQQVYGYRGQPPVADCVEACVREAIGLALWDGQAYDASRLPECAAPELLEHLRVSGASDGAEAGQSWFDLLSARPGLDYMLGGWPQDRYELFPSIDNFANALGSLVGVDVKPPLEGGELSTVWPGSRLLWQRAGSDRHPELRFCRPADDRVCHEEEIRVVFNGARHCYSIRDAKTTEPAWVGRVRQAWRRQLPRAAPAAAAAARLLELRGPVLIARHEMLHREAAQTLAAAETLAGAAVKLRS